MLGRVRFAALLLAVLTVAFSLASCAAPGVLSYGETAADARLFTYALTLTKTQTLAALSGSSTELEDSPELWKTDTGSGKTYGDLVLEKTLSTFEMTLFYANWAKENGVTPDEELKANTRETISKILSTFSSRKEFDRYMGTYGFDYDLICRYYELDALSTAGMRAYYQYPATSLTQADVKAYYRENFVTCLYLAVNEKNQTLANGKTVPLTEDEKAERTAFFEKAAEDVKAGGDLAGWVKRNGQSEFGEEPAAATYQLSSVSPAELREALTEMDEEEVRAVETPGARYLVKRFKPDENYFEENTDALFSAVVSLREKEILQEHGGEFVKNETFFSELDISSLPIF